MARDLRLGIWGWGNWAPEAGGTQWAELGEPGQPLCITALVRYWVRTLLAKASEGISMDIGSFAVQTAMKLPFTVAVKL